MSVSYDAIIDKMIQELETARSHQGHEAKLQRHILNVRLLCDLIAENDRSYAEQSANMTNEEWKTMIGDLRHSKGTVTHHDGANGDSIFDF
ncbi:MAG TPA: YwdI family protein [Bacillota bacterium]|nr:YwdI family protein [Bacillota bacterium]